MADYNSKYTGEEVEQLLDQVANGEIGGGGETLTEADIANMGFTKNVGTITEVKMNGVSKGESGVVDLGNVVTEHHDISGKVDKVIGKGLSTEDYTTALKGKLEGLSNYDDTALSNALTTLRNDFDKLVSGDSTTAIKTFNEIVAFLDGIADTEDLASIIASIEQQIAGKQATITDLATIREGAAKGATSVQPSDIPEETYLAGFTMDSLRQGMNNGSQVDCDINSLIEAMSANKTILVREDEASDGFNGVYVLNGYAEDLLYFSIVDSQGNILYCEGVDYTNTSTYIDGRALHIRRWDDKVDSKALSAVATSGSYNDLSDKPTIPSAVTEATVSGWGFTKNTGTYSKPNGGIPKTDLSSDVQSALGKAESAVQRDKYGDMDSIQTHGFEGSLSGKLYALPDEATGDEDETLLSTHNVKTINGQSILGKGNISIESGGSGKEIVKVDDVWTISPNKIYVLDHSDSGGTESVSIGIIETSDALIDEYAICFKTGEGAFIIPMLSLPSNVKWANGVYPEISAGTLYELSIVKTRLGDTDYFKAVLTSFK